MRKTLIESLTHGPLTEPAPKPDEAAVAELAQSVNRAAHARLGRSFRSAMSMPAHATAASWKSMR